MARLSLRGLVFGAAATAALVALGCGARNELPPGEEAAGGASGWMTTTGASPSGPSTSSGVTTSTSASTSDGVTSSTGSSSVGGGGEGGGPTGCAPDCTGDHLWSAGFGDMASQYGLSVATDSDGNIVVVGYVNGGVDFGGGILDMGWTNDAFVVKFDPFGNHIWSKAFGEVPEDENEQSAHYAWSVAIDSADNVVVAGNSWGPVDFGGGTLTGEPGVFVAKLDPSGNHVWSKRFEGGTWYPAVAVDPADSVILTGQFEGVTNFGGLTLTSAGEDDVFVAKFDASGDHMWSQRFGDSYSQHGGSVVADAFGNVILTGSYMGELGFGGEILPPEFGGYDLFLVKLDPSGNHVWSKSFGDFGSQTGDAVATTDGSGNVIIAGAGWGMIDFGGGPLLSNGDGAFVAKLDAASGGYVWAEMFGGDQDQSATSVAVDDAGDIVITGSYEAEIDFGGGMLTSAGWTDIFVAKLDRDGNHLWSKGFGSAADGDVGHCVTTDKDDSVIVTGTFGGVVDFGGGGITGQGSGDVFLLKLAP